MDTGQVLLTIMIVSGLLSVVLVGYIAGREVERRKMERELVKRGYAEYNQTNGQWCWKEKK